MVTSLVQRRSTGKWRDRIHEYSVLRISKIHSESATRFISCDFTRNSVNNRLRIVTPAREHRTEQVRNDDELQTSDDVSR